MGTALRGWRKAEAPAAWAKVHTSFGNSADEETRRLIRELSLVFGDGRAMDELHEIAAKSRDIAARRSAIRALVATRDKSIVPLLNKLLGDRDLGVEAIRGLAAFDDPGTPALLIDRFADFRREPARHAAITTLTARRESARQLLQAVAAGKIGRQHVSAFQLRQLQLLEDARINADIERLWPELKEISSEKLAQIAKYRETLTPDVIERADLSAGRAHGQRRRSSLRRTGVRSERRRFERRCCRGRLSRTHRSRR